MDIVYIGKILRTYGLNGKVIVQAFADIPRNLKPGTAVWIEPEESHYSRLTITSVLQHKKTFRVEFREITDKSKAERLVKKHFGVSRKLLEKLPGNEFYVFDLIGCNVLTVLGEPQGQVDDVVSNPGNDLLRVTHKEGHFFVPFVKEIIKSIDLARQEIIIESIEGLTEPV